MTFLGIIPARYGSSRFPGKPLAMLGSKPLIQRVYERAADVLDTVVATDDDRIYQAVEAFGGQVVMTSSEHKTGTDRIAEAISKVSGQWDVILNIQGDEPFVNREQLEALMGCFDGDDTQIGTLAKYFKSIDELLNPNRPKLVVNKRMEAMYFSRNAIPYMAKHPQDEWLKRHTYYKHIGLYAFRQEVLYEISKLPQSDLELAESLEQIRWLQNGYRIKVALTDHENLAIDTPEDLQKILQLQAWD